MPANRKRLAVSAPEDRWQLLGELLAERRRVGLGVATMVAFARERLPLTPEGNPNRRRVDDLENNRRPNRWPEPTLKEMAAAYGVTYASVRAVLDGKADKLDPAAPAQPAVIAPLPAPPPSNLLREDAARPWFAPLWNRLLELAANGVPDPDGVRPSDFARWSPSAAQLGLSGADADAWNGSRGAMILADRAWLTADLRARRASGNPARDTAANGA